MLNRYIATLMLTLAIAGAGGPILFSLTGADQAQAAGFGGGPRGR